MVSYDAQIFQEYDDCTICQGLILKNENLSRIREHLNESHLQIDIALYVCSRKDGFRSIFLELYNLTKPYHEPNFDIDLKLAFHSKTWEMIVARSLINSDRKIESNARQMGPDFTTDSAYIECINASPSKDHSPKLQNPGELIFQEVPESDIQLRITNAFAKKSKIIKKYLDNGIINSKKPTIIAINYSGVDEFAWADNEELSDNFVLRSLFAMGPLSMSFNPEREAPQEFKVSFKPQLLKNEKTNVPADYFLNDSDKHISAVIYSNHQIESDQSDQLVVVNNPFAEVTIDMNDYKDMQRVVADLKTSTLRKVSRGELV